MNRRLKKSLSRAIFAVFGMLSLLFLLNTAKPHLLLLEITEMGLAYYIIGRSKRRIRGSLLLISLALGLALGLIAVLRW